MSQKRIRNAIGDASAGPTNLNYVIGSVAILCENTNILRKCRYAKIRIFYENTDTMRKCEIFYGNADTMRKCEMFYENTDAMRKCKSYTEGVVHANWNIL